MSNERSLLERARRGFVHHLCDNGVITPGLTCLACEIDALLRAAEPEAKPLGLGERVTYTPRYPSQVPHDGWTVVRLPTEPVYVIKHENGTAITASGSEIARPVLNREGSR